MNSYMPPIPEPQPVDLPNRPTTYPQRHFASAMLVPDENNRMFHTSVQNPNRYSSNSRALHDRQPHPQPTSLSNQSHQYLTQYGPCDQRAYAQVISSQAESSGTRFKRKHTTQGYSCPGSSSTVTQPPIMPACFWTPASTSIGNGYGGDCTFPPVEHFQRNVRSRYDPPLMNYPPYQIHATSMVEECAPPFHGIGPTWTLASSGRFHGRQSHDRISSSYTPPGVFAAASQHAASSVSRSIVLPRYPRPTTWNAEPRSSNVAPSARHGSMNALSIIDRFDTSDDHRDLRLDIDDMTYEELLALEERIGNVSTGLSEYHISLYLSQTTYCSSECEREVSCPICLEEYEEKEDLGILKCQHAFHVGCIKSWLSIKNACPICKAPAVDDSLKKKGKAAS